MINPEGTQSTFWRICDDNGNCHCDWRLTLGDCAEDQAMRIIYIINIIGSAVVSVIGIALLFYRLYYRKQQIFTNRTPTGFIRPKPIEAMLFMAIIFNLLRMIQAIIIVTDAAPNPAFRSFMYEIPWQFGLGAFACYVFGIAHTVADSSKTIYSAMFSSPLRIDILSTTFITMPFITNNICSIAAGIYAERGEDFIAGQFTHAQYYFWTIYCGSLGFMILFAGIKLLRLLGHHLRMQHDLRTNIAKIKTGSLKVKIIMLVGCVCLWVFALVLCLYGVLRDQIIRNTGYNLAISAVWTYDGVVATLLVEMALILNPRMTASLGVSGVSTNGSQSDPSGGTTLSTSYAHNVTSIDSAKWDKFDTLSHPDHTLPPASVGGGNMMMMDDGLPRYSVGADMGMDILHGNKQYSTPDSRQHDMQPHSRPISPSSVHRHQIEQDQLHYNATSQVRTPPRYVITPMDEQQGHPENYESFSTTLGRNGSVISASHLMGYNNGHQSFALTH
ncbi:hypothetical protein O0I10_008729 [Lichtheimia ornata]|uniref:Uncharacterized protein n=1 Tax=Lichtheimia ornata TaxID=688661 RepID=A0AAD7XV63_9FUNG|nr:uncharacterized protein O0I10_008729 [Lichtheimia ornata]KAJ8655640.1 hypothetical protein O0I10_008729 [Lichtheimia ornata]